MPSLSTSALTNHASNYVFVPERTHGTIESFYEELTPQLEESLQDLLVHHLEWKVHSCLEVKMRKGELFYFIQLLIFYCIIRRQR